MTTPKGPKQVRKEKMKAQKAFKPRAKKMATRINRRSRRSR